MRPFQYREVEHTAANFGFLASLTGMGGVSTPLSSTGRFALILSVVLHRHEVVTRELSRPRHDQRIMKRIGFHLDA